MAAPRLALAFTAAAAAVTLVTGCTGDSVSGAASESSAVATNGEAGPVADPAADATSAPTGAEVEGPAEASAAEADAPPDEATDADGATSADLDELREAAAAAQGPGAGAVKAAAARAAAEQSPFDRDLAVRHAGDVVVAVRAVDEALQSRGDAAVALLQLRERYVALGDAGTPAGPGREAYAPALQRLVQESSRAAEDMASRPDVAVEVYAAVRQETARLLDQVGAAVGTSFRL